jgi:hypothetical protein
VDFSNIPRHPRQSQENFGDSVRFLKHFFLLENTTDKQLHIIPSLFKHAHNLSTATPSQNNLKLKEVGPDSSQKDFSPFNNFSRKNVRRLSSFGDLI